MPINYGDFPSMNTTRPGTPAVYGGEYVRCYIWVWFQKAADDIQRFELQFMRNKARRYRRSFLHVPKLRAEQDWKMCPVQGSGHKVHMQFMWLFWTMINEVCKWEKWP